MAAGGAGSGRPEGEFTGMAEAENRKRRVPLRPKSRLEAFSDGVFAIAITLLALDIDVPAGSEDDLLQAVLDQWPSYIAYLVSFSSIGAIWLKHSAITDLMPRTDSGFLRLNLSLLIFVCFLPFPTRLVADSLNAGTDAERTAVVLYGLNLFLISALVGLVWTYALRQRLIDARLDEDEAAWLTRQLTPTIGVYVVAILLGLAFPIAAVVLMLAIAVLMALPPRTIARAFRGRLA
jgi:uncharacterized membrane protein